MKLRVFSYWLSLDDKQKTDLFKDPKELAEIKEDIHKLHCPDQLTALVALNEAFKTTHHHSLTHVHEYIKLKTSLFKDVTGLE